MSKRIRWGCSPAILMFLTAAVLAPSQAAQLCPGERLEYTFSYQGILSGFAQIDIARAVFGVASKVEKIQGRETYLTSLSLTTEPFGKMELIYPIRYHYRSWVEPEGQAPLLVSESLETDETSEEILWFDRDNRLGYRYVEQDDAVGPEAKPPRFLLEVLGLSGPEGDRLSRKHHQRLSEPGVWDYLSMLYRLRFLNLEAGRVFELPLFNGKRIKHYRVAVSHVRLTEAGWDRPAFKLNLSEVRGDKSRRKPLTEVWVSDDEERLPLRFHVARSFGEVEGILETGRPSIPREEDISDAADASLRLVF